MATSCFVFFRNDDVALPESSLHALTDIFIKRKIPIVHAVEPGNLKQETSDWLLSTSSMDVEIIQHGFRHVQYGHGEFGGERSAEVQYHDAKDGKTEMELVFGQRFFPAFSFPYGAYNKHSMHVLDSLGFIVVSSSVKFSFLRRSFNWVGQKLQRDILFDRPVSYHLLTRPRTRIRDISVCISPITQYFGGHDSTDCVFADIAELKMLFMLAKKRTAVIGIVLHHRYYSSAERLYRLEELLDWLLKLESVKVVNLETIYSSIISTRI